MQKSTKWLIGTYLKNYIFCLGAFVFVMSVIGILSNSVSTPDVGGEYLAPSLIRFLIINCAATGICTLLDYFIYLSEINE